MLDCAQPSVTETVKAAGGTACRKRRVRWMGAALAVLLAAVVAAGLKSRENAETVRYRTEPVRRGDMVITVTATGNLAATNQVDVGSELSGIIKSMTADYNDRVGINQPLVYLDDAKYRAAVTRSRAEVASAEAGYREAVATRDADAKKLARYRKTRELTGGKLPSTEEMEQAEAELERSAAAVDAATAAVAIARADLEAAETDLNKTVIYSPVNGIVLSRDVEPGQTVAASLSAPVLYTLAEDLRYMELRVDVDEADVGLVREGQPAVFTVDAYPDRSFSARITQVRYGAETTGGVVTYKTVLRVENPDLLLRPGMTATAEITVRKIEQALLVPNAALLFTPDSPDMGDDSRRNLLNALLPGPPRMRQSKKTGGNSAPGDDDASARVWVLEDNRPVPVPVEKVATDGGLTVVASGELREGKALIVNTVTAGG